MNVFIFPDAQIEMQVAGSSSASIDIHYKTPFAFIDVGSGPWGLIFRITTKYQYLPLSSPGVVHI